MFRARWAALALGAGIGLACGCCSLANHPLFGGCCGEVCAPACEGCEAEAPLAGVPLEGGPLLEGYPAAPGMPAPAAPGVPMPPAPGLMPQAAVPPLASPPRLVPMPQAAPEAYRP